MKHKTVILLSGGLDSAANLAFCVEQDEPVLALTLRYGQRSETQELHAAQSLSAYYCIRHQVVDVSWLGKLGGGALTERQHSVPVLGADELDNPQITSETARQVWVPNRNGVFIHVAAAFAERLGVSRVVVGFNQEEAQTFPDNSQDYIRAVNRALSFSTANQVEVFSYTASMNKKEIVARLRNLSRAFPFDRVWSCYNDGKKPCEKCESCQRFKRATS